MSRLRWFPTFQLARSKRGGALLRRFCRAREGSVATIVALTFPVLMGSAAFSIDLGYVHLEQRSLQKAVDAAAMAAAADLDHADGVVRRLLAANNNADATFTMSTGRFRANPDLAPANRFAPDGDANGVTIEATRTVPTFFARILGFRSITISARATAADTPIVSFSIGSRLATADPPLVDAILRPLIGTSLGLNVLDYRSLARSQVPFGSLLRAIAASDGLAPNATVGDVLKHPVLFSALLSVTAVELNANDDPSGAAILRKAGRNTVGTKLAVRPGDLLNTDEKTKGLRLDYPHDAFAAKVAVLSLFSATVTDRSIGNEVAVQIGLPGLNRTDLGVLLGEAEQHERMAVVGRADESPSAATAQARLSLVAQTDIGTVLPGVEATIPIEAVVAGARATVTSVTCSADPAKREVRVAVIPGIVRLSVGSSGKKLKDMAVTDTVRPATIAATPAIRIEVGSSIALRQASPVEVTFRGSEIGNNTSKTVRTRKLAESLVVTLIGEAELSIRLGPLGLGLPNTLTAPIRMILAGLAAPLDAALDATLAAAGIGLGEADVRVDAIVCGRSHLVG